MSRAVKAKMVFLVLLLSLLPFLGEVKAASAPSTTQSLHVL